MKELEIKAELQSKYNSGYISYLAMMTVIRHLRRGGNEFNQESGFKQFADGTEQLTDDIKHEMAKKVTPKPQREGD